MQVTHDTLFAAELAFADLASIATILCGMTKDQLDALAAKPNRGKARNAPPYMVLRATVAKKLAEGDWRVSYTAGALHHEVPSELQAKAQAAEEAATQQAKGAPHEQAEAEEAATQQAKGAPHEQAEAEEAEASGQGEPERTTQADAQNGAQQEQPKARAARGAKQEGAYHVAKRPGTKSTEATDPAKWAIWQHVWECSTFEDFYAKAPAKATRSTGKPITAASEIGWALKQGWIVPGPAPR